MTSITLSIDLTKNMFQLPGVDEHGTVVVPRGM